MAVSAGGPSPRAEDRTRTGSGLVHVFSSSYLGRLFKNPFSLSSIAPFKMRPMRNRADRYSLPERPLTGRACSTCFDSTVLDQWGQPTVENFQATIEQQKSQKLIRLCDVLELPSTACRASYSFIKRIGDIVYCIKSDVNRAYPRVDAAVLTSARVQEGIFKNVSRALDEDEDTLASVVSVADHDLSKTRKQRLQAEHHVAKERANAKSTLKRMGAHISGFILKITAYVLFKLLRLILRTVQISPAQVEKIKKMSEENMPMIYLPNHRSHLDYILLSFILAQFGFRTPYVAAGDNLDIPVFSWILRSLGAFFIKRRLDKNAVYRAVLHSYIEELLKQGESLEFFVEAGRSRTGRPIIPKAGLLSVVVETYLHGHIPNAYIVPVSVSYEKLIEGNFDTELMGEPKKQETFWAAVKGIWNVFCTKYGSVRVDFGQPVTIQAYLEQLRKNLAPLPSSDAAEATVSIFDFTQKPYRMTSPASRTSLFSLCSVSDNLVIADENRRLIKAMCNHIVYDFSRNSALMCTQMLAFLLTTKYRRGGRLDDIVDDFHWLCRRVMASGRDIGFSGDPRDVVRYAMELLGQDLVSSEISDIDSGVGSDSGLGGWNAIGSGARYEKDSTTAESHLWIVRPTSTLPKVLELAYYAAPVGLVFLQEAVIANALFSASLDASKSAKSGSTIHSSKIIERALALTDLLQHEFLFTSPCVSMRQCLEQALEQMVQDGLVVKRGYSTTSSTSTSSTYGVRFCLDKNQLCGPTSSASSRAASSSSLTGLDDDSAPITTTEKPARKRRSGAEETFYLPSEDDDLADYEDEADDDEEDDDDLFGRRYASSSIRRRRSSYGIASLMDSEDDYNADVIRLYASTLAPLLEAYKFAFKKTVAELAQPAGPGGMMKSQRKTETELVQKLVFSAKEAANDGSSLIYAEAVNIEAMRNAVRWLVLKGVLISSQDRVRLHDSYVDDREALERFCAEIDDLCVVVTY